MSSENSVAIIGMHGRFPKSPSLESFWNHLQEGKELITFFSDKELAALQDSLEKYHHYVKAKGFLEDADCFDASFFGYNAREADLMDPQHRVLLECAWHAMENAGYDPWQIEKSIGVFTGCSVSTYLLFNVLPNLMQTDWQNPYTQSIAMTGNDKDFLSTRISYKLNLTGSSQTIQTACSTSLVAIHTACQNLLDFSCDIALAGGVSITCPLKSGYVYFKEGINSPDGHCRAFDAKAEGTLIGNGAGLVVLRRLEDAIKDRDHIHAVILGSAVNNDGRRKLGYTTPSIEGQTQVISEALTLAGINPDTLSYVEAHGTGTIIGDPVEVKALTRAFRAWTNKKQFCAIGSVKSNMGHLDAAAGVAGLIKVVLSMQHKKLPPSLHYSSPNPELHLETTPFYVNDKLINWKANHTPLRAGISSFGIGGTNAHVILEEAPIPHPFTETNQEHLLTLSATHPKALKQIKLNLIEALRHHTKELGDVAFTLNTGRRQFPYRSFIQCKDRADAIQQLSQCLNENVESIPSSLKPLIWIFPDTPKDQLSSASYPVVRKTIDKCLRHFETLWGASPDFTIQQAMIHFSIQYALADLLKNLGNLPGQILGFGIGQYVAAVIATIMTVEEAMALIVQSLKKDTNFSAIQSIHLSAPSIPLLSPVNPSYPIQASSLLKMDYWLEQLSTPSAVCALNDLSSHFIPLLIQADKQQKDLFSDSYLYLSCSYSFLTELGQLWKRGYISEWMFLYKGCNYHRTVLPGYPFEKVRHWVESPQNPLEKSKSQPVEQASSPSITGLEGKLIDIWKHTFQISHLDPNESFFDIGGDSLIALEIKNLINHHFYIDVPIRTFFDKPTVKEMADFIRNLLLENIDKLTEQQTDTILMYLEK